MAACSSATTDGTTRRIPSTVRQSITLTEGQLKAVVDILQNIPGAKIFSLYQKEEDKNAPAISPNIGSLKEGLARSIWDPSLPVYCCVDALNNPYDPFSFKHYEVTVYAPPST